MNYRWVSSRQLNPKNIRTKNSKKKKKLFNGFFEFSCYYLSKIAKGKKPLLGEDSLEFMFIADFTELIASSIIQIGV